MHDDPPTLPAPVAADPARRRWLRSVGAASLAAAAGTSMQPARAAVKTNARIVIAGSGLGGLAVASRLSRLLDGARITIVDGKEEHNYQPGYTLVATGVWPVDKIRDRNADLQPAGVEWVKDMLASFDPASNSLTTKAARRSTTTSLSSPPGCTWTTRRSRAWMSAPSAATA